MNPTDDPAPAPVPPSAPADEPDRSGEGAATALQALIRKRKMGEIPEADPPPPAHPQP